MQYALKLVTPPATEVVSVAEARLHCYVDDPAQDNILLGFITAARQHLENTCNRAFCTQVWDMMLDAWPKREIVLPRAPLQSVASITYTDSAGVETVLPPTAYLVDTASEPGRVVPAYGLSWPSVTLRPVGGVRVRFTAGYGVADDVPRAIKQAVLLLVGQWYDGRENVVVGSQARELPFAVKALVAPYRVAM